MSCNPKAPSGNDSGSPGEHEEEEEDLTVFFTPELFDDDSEQGPKSPLQGENPALQSEEALQEVRNESLDQSWEQKERQLEKEMEEEKEGQKSHPLFRRLSRSRQAVSSPPEGN